MKKTKIYTAIAASLLLFAPDYAGAFKPSRTVNIEYSPDYNTGVDDYSADHKPQNHRGITHQGIRNLLANGSDYKFSAEVIETIKQADSSVDGYSTGFKDSILHCDNELLKECSDHVKLWQTNIVATLLASSDIDTARKWTGRTLHTLQDFYAHSNYAYLTLIKKWTPRYIMETGFLASNLKGNGVVDCTWNYQGITKIDFAMDEPAFFGDRGESAITSGYFYDSHISFIDATQWDPPRYKCKHGENGKGINNDHPDAIYFRTARDLAVDASTHFMNEIFKRVRSDAKNYGKSTAEADEILRKYTGMTKTSPVGFVIDTTGSMGDTIEGIKKALTQFANTFGLSPTSPLEVFVMPYGDPNIGEILTAKNIKEMLANINTVTLGVPDDGGDWEEQTTLALKKMVETASDNTEIFVYTDANTHYPELADEIIVNAKKKNIAVTFFSSNGGSIDETYKKIARNTGGLYFSYEHTVAGAESTFSLVNRRFAGNLQDVVNTSSSSSSSAKKMADRTTVTLAPNVQLYTSPTGNAAYHIMPVSKQKAAALKTVKMLSATAVTNQRIINVDSTVTNLLVTIGMSPLGNITLIRPNGTEVKATDTNVTLNTSSVGETIVVNKPAIGQWKLKIQAEPDAIYDVSVKMNSDLRFISFNFAEEKGRPGHTGLFPIDGQPLVTEKQYFTLVLAGAINTSNLVLSGLDGNEIKRITLTNPTIEGDSRSYIGAITLPNQDFRVSVKGKDNKGNVFERLYPNVYLGQSVKVIPIKIYPNVAKGKTFKTKFIIENHGLNDEFTINATNSLDYPITISTPDLAVGAKKKTAVEVAVTVPFAAPVDSELNIILTAKSKTNAKSTNTAISNFVVKNLKEGDIDNDGDVDTDDLRWISQDMNTPAYAVQDPRDLNGDMKIDALDGRRLVLLCTRPRCATK